MGTLLKSVQYIVGLGASVFLPIVMFVIGLIFGMKPLKALRSALTLGVAFTALTLFISQLLVGQMAPAAQAMITRTGLHLTALDVGWPAASTISWAWKYAAIMFPLQVFLNLFLLWINFTKTLNVDLWNVWQKVFAGAVLYGLTGNLFWSFVVAIVMIVIELKIGDYDAKRSQELLGVQGISFPHTCFTWLLAVAPVGYLLDRIPLFNRVKTDPLSLQKKIGIFGENIIIGFILGFLIGILAGYPVSKILVLSIVTATIIVVVPRLASIFMEALNPISEAAQDFMKKHAPGREFYIGLDWPLYAGHPSTIVAAVLLIPVLILLAIILPGNKVLPFGDLGNFGCIMAPAVFMAGGDLIKTLIIGVFILAVSLWGASAAATSFTKVAIQSGVKMPEGATEIAWLKTSPIIWAIISFVQKNFIIVAILVILAVVSFYILKKYYSSGLKKEG